MAQEKSNDPRIKAIGRDIAAQHGVLDKLVRDAAKKLDVDLPNKPNADQQKWLSEMREAEGEEFDQIYIDRLRAAHGKIFPAIATIRASTRNDTVRKLAQRTNQFVMTHMTLLESSGIVDFAGLPTAPPSAAATTGPAAQAQKSVSSATPLSVGGAPVLPIVVVALVSIALTVFACSALHDGFPSALPAATKPVLRVLTVCQTDAMTKPRTIDEYIEGVAGLARELLEQLHALARATVPDASEAIKWGHPAWVHPSGTILFVISGHAKHANFTFTPQHPRGLRRRTRRPRNRQGHGQAPVRRPGAERTCCAA
nr:hypothetical protein GCM10020092_071490 [Actinoplanes digitatis]